MAVVDKYRPIRLDPLTRDPWVPTVASVWVCVAALGLLGADGLHRAAVALDDGPVTDVLVAVTGGLEAFSRGLGLLAARQAVDEALEVLEDSTRWWEAPRAPPPPPARPPGPPSEERAAPAPSGPTATTRPRPERILVAGASSIEYRLGAEIERRLGAYEGVRVERVGKLGTGLIRDDVFDWPAEIAARMASFHPDVVVVQLGGNDGQPIDVVGQGRVSFGSGPWMTAYEERVERLVDRIEEGGALPVLLGLPVMKDPAFSDRVKVINEVLARVAAAEGARFVETWSLTADVEGGYRTHLTWEGREALMRLPDGVHLSTEGSAFVAQELMLRFEREFTLVDPGSTGAVVVRGELDSPARGKVVPFLAAVPREVPPEGLPVLYLLHGAWDDHTAWWTHAHRELQALAAAHRLIVLTPHGEPFGWYLDSDLVPSNQIATHLVAELIPAAERLLPADGRRSIAGLSMGGHGAILLALDHPGLFAAASSMSGALDLDRVPTSEQLTALLGPYRTHRAAWDRHNVARRLEVDVEVARRLPLWITCGTKDVWFSRNLALHERLDALGVAHGWEATEGAGHTWETWVAALPEHVAWHRDQLDAAAAPGR